MKNVFIVGGAGFIGSHFVEHLLLLDEIERVTVYDNFSSGKIEHLKSHKKNPRLTIIKKDIHDLSALIKAMKNHDTVIHLASNPDIARATIEPSIDFKEGTVLTENVLEAMRITHAKRILYASGSGVYGDVGEREVNENFGPLQPISTYGASKLAGEALICSYAHMFDITGVAFRFGNVVGPHQTHGVGYDFIRKLRANSTELTILGNGTQSKSYVYISDIISAVMCADTHCKKKFDVFNVATGDYITVNDIARIAISKVVSDKNETRLLFSGGDRGWKGDVPIVRLNTDKIRSLGWKPQFNSAESITKSIEAMLTQFDTFSLADELWDNENVQKKYNADLVAKLSRIFKESDCVADFGAGIGTLASTWETMTNQKPICIETDPNLQQVLKNRGFVCYRSIEALHGKLLLDGVYTSNVLEHIENDLEALLDIHSVLKKDAALAIFVPAFPILFGQLDKAAGHYRRYSKKDIISKLKKANFNIVQCEYAESIGFFVMIAIKLLGYKNKLNLGSEKSMRIYDRFIYPLSRLLDWCGLKYLFGKNILVVAKKKK